MISDTEYLFMYLVAVCMSFFLKNVYSDPLTILNFFKVLTCLSFLYILNINLLSEVYASNIFL
jgi:hypothetical protein